MRGSHRPRSLSARLLVGLLVVCGLGLTVSLLAGTVLLRDYLYDRASEQIAAVGGGPGPGPASLVAGRLCRAPAAEEVLPSDFRLTVLGTDGTVVCRVPAGVAGPPVPDRAELRAADATAAGSDDEGAGDDGVANGVRIVDGEGGPWARTVVALSDGGSGGSGGVEGRAGYAVVAISLRDADATVQRLTIGGLVVGALVLGLLAVVGAWVIRIGLRPLTEVREAARGIRRGDLSARVPLGTPGTEVAELAAVLNSMLTELEQGYDERRESERRIRRFAADASHELRTPLTSIKGYAQLYAQLRERDGGAGSGGPGPGDGTGDRRDDVVRRIDTEADRMTRIVEDLLLLARLDQQPGVHSEQVDLVEVGHDVLTAARARRPDRRVDLRVTGPVEVVGDRGRLAQVLGNLVDNALVHTPSAVTVTLAVRGDAAVVEVTDGGPGMPEHVRSHVFDRFYRADPGRPHDGGGGSGLGLAIVAALVAAHGGAVTCTSSVETGSTFTVTLPRA